MTDTPEVQCTRTKILTTPATLETCQESSIFSDYRSLHVGKKKLFEYESYLGLKSRISSVQFYTNSFKNNFIFRTWSDLSIIRQNQRFLQFARVADHVNFPTGTFRVNIRLLAKFEFLAQTINNSYLNNVLKSD